MILSFIKQHIYIFLLFLTTTEGPITTFVAAGFAAQWYLNFFYIAIIALVWDLIWDITIYCVWRGSHRLKFTKKFHYFLTQKSFLKKLLDRSTFLYFLIVKITPYLATPALMFVWVKKMKFSKYFAHAFITSLLVKAVYLTIWYFGAVSIKELTHFLNGWKQIIIYIISGIILFLATKRLYIYLSKIIKKKITDLT